jgi:hypothetical protein
VRTRRGGRLLTPLLLVIGSVVTALAILAGWAQWQLMDTAAFRDTSGKMLERKEIRDRVAEYVVTEVRSASGGALPPALGNRLERAVARRLATSRSERVWRTTTTEAHRELVRMIEDDRASRGDVVVLDLRPLIRSVARELGIPLPIVPASVGQVEIVAGDEVRGVRNAADELHRTATVLLIAAPLILLLAVAAASGWRTQALAGAGVSVAAAGALVLITRALVGAHVVDVLSPRAADRDAAAAAWAVGTSQLAWIAGAAIVVGLIVAVLAGIAGRAGAGARPQPRYL